MKPSASLRVAGLVVCMSLAQSLLLAKDTVWTGAASGDWNNVANWDNGVPVNGDNIFLTDQGTAPANQNISNLELGVLSWGVSGGDEPPSDGLTIVGEAFSANRVTTPNNANAPSTYTIDVPFTIAGTSSWSIGSQITLVFNQTVSETSGLGFAWPVNNNGTVRFNDQVTTTGGFRNNQSTLVFQSPETLAALPASPDIDYFRSGFGGWQFLSSDGISPTIYDFDANVGFETTNGADIVVGSSIDNDPVKLIIRGDMIENAPGKTFNLAGNDSSEDGILVVKGDFNASGLDVTSGYVRLEGGVMADATSTETGVGANGTLDLYGNDFLGRDLSFSNGSGVQGLGNIVNQNYGTTSTLDGNITSVGSGSGGPTFGGQGDIDFTGNITDASGGQAFEWVGSGLLTFRGESSYPGPTQISNGTVIYDYRANNNSKAAAGANFDLDAKFVMEGNASADTLQQVGDLRLSQNSQDGAARITLNAGTGQSAEFRFDDLVINGFTTLDFNPDANSTITSTIGGFNQVNTGLMGGRFTYRGETFAEISTTPDANSNFAIQGFSGYLSNDFASVADNAYVDVSGTQTISGGSVARGGLRFNSTGAATLTLSSDLNLYGNDDDGNGSDAGILVTANVGANQITIDGSEKLASNGLNANLTIHQYNTAAPLRIDARIYNFTSGNDLIKSGPGELILTNVENSFTDLAVFDGTLTFSGGANGGGTKSALGTDGAPVTLGNATLKFQGATHTVNKSITLQGRSTLEADDQQLDGSPGGKVTYDGGISVGSHGANLVLTGDGEGEISTDIAIGLGGVEKHGSGTWTLSGTNTYVGNTLLTNGTLLINGTTHQFSETTVTGGVLGGTGTVGGETTFEGGTLSPGNSPGTLAFSGDLTLSASTLSRFELDFAGSTTDDLVTVGGALTLDGDLEVVDLGGFGAGRYLLFTYSGGFTDNGLSISSLPGGFSGSIDTSVLGEVALNVVPEPGTAGLLLIGSLLILARRRRDA